MRRMFSEKQLENQTEELLSSGNLPSVKADEIIENMEGYDFEIGGTTGYTKSPIYAGICKNGNKLTAVIFLNITKTSEAQSDFLSFGSFSIPSTVLSKLVATNIGGITAIDVKELTFIASDFTTPITQMGFIQKGDTGITLGAYVNDLVQDSVYSVRFECTFLLSDNMAE